MKSNVIEARPGDTIRRIVRIIWNTCRGKRLYKATGQDRVLLKLYDKNMELISETDCEIRDGEIIANFPTFEEKGQYFYEMQLILNTGEKYTFADAELIIGRRDHNEAL